MNHDHVAAYFRVTEAFRARPGECLADAARRALRSKRRRIVWAARQITEPHVDSWRAIARADRILAGGKPAC